MEFLAPNMTSYLQPDDMDFYQTVKERYKSYLRNYTIHHDKISTLAGPCIATSDIMKNMEKELVKAFWKISGLSNQNGTDLE